MKDFQVPWELNGRQTTQLILILHQTLSLTSPRKLIYSKKPPISQAPPGP